MKNKDRERFDIEMMRNPDRWPSQQILPMKMYYKGKYPDGSECEKIRFGVMANGHGPKVYMGNYILSIVDCANYPFVEFPTYQAIWDAGWMVD